MALTLDPAPGPVETASPQLRCRIMAVAERLFRDIGYRKTTVADIGVELGRAPANLYRGFPSKKALNEAVTERMLDGLADEMATIAADPTTTAPQRLRRLLHAMQQTSTRLFINDRRMHDMVEAAMAESWQVIHAHIGRVEAVLQRLVADGIADGHFAPRDPLVAARCIHSAVIRYCHPALIEQCVDEPGPTIDEMTDFLLAALAKPTTAGA